MLARAQRWIGHTLSRIYPAAIPLRTCLYPLFHGIDCDQPKQNKKGGFVDKIISTKNAKHPVNNKGKGMAEINRI